jgi:hypothetical protein
MKILSNVTMAGNVNMSSTNKDTFTIGTPLENNDGNVDDLYVYANADFKNNVILGSSSLDTVTANAPIIANAGIIGTASHAATASNYYVSIAQAGGNSGNTFPVAYGFSSDIYGKSVNILSIKQGTNIVLSQATGNLTIDVDQTAWTAYTPTWTAASTNPVIGNGTIEGYYKVIGKTCFVRGNIAMGSTTTFGSGEWYVSMPFTASHADAILMTVTLLDNGSAWYNATLNGARAGFNTKAAMQFVNHNNGTAGDVNATNPFTWANGDRFIWNGSYEIA